MRVETNVPSGARGLRAAAFRALAGGHLTEAVRAFEGYLRLNPSDAYVMFRLADCENDQGNLAAAEHWYDKFLELEPESIEAKENLALIWAERRGDHDRAIRALEELQPELRDAGMDDFLHLDLAWVHHLAGRRDKALGHLHEAVGLGILKSLQEIEDMRGDTGFADVYYIAEAHYRFAAVSLDAGEDRDRTLFHLRQAIRLSPESVYARDAQTLLAQLDQETG